MAEWVSTWGAPFLFGIDANSPLRDPLEPGPKSHYESPGPGEPGEDLLIGPPDTVVHHGVDLWRAWLRTPTGRADLDAVPEAGPLAGTTAPGLGSGCATTRSGAAPTSPRWP